jgi:DNA-binding transcriptional MerR regulator
MGGRAPTESDAEGEQAGEERFTIDELAAATGVPSRTIRYYQSKGALPAPERRGRVAYYAPLHVERLQLIAELQDRGLRLDAIRDVVHHLEGGTDSLQEWLGLGDRLQAPWTDERPVVLSRAELEARARENGVERNGAVRAGLLADLERVGLARRTTSSHPSSYLVPSPGLLDIGLQLEAAGVDIATGDLAQGILRKRLAQAADELVNGIAERAGRGFGRLGEPTDLTESFEALRPLGIQAVQLIFAQEIERSLRRFVETGGVVRTLPTAPGGSRPRQS